MLCPLNLLSSQKNVEQTLKTDGAEAANKLVHDKEHKPSYLIGRLIRKKEEKKQKAALGTTRTLSVPGHEYAKIRADIEKELDEKLEQKFQDMVKKLAEQNPGLKINLDESDKSTEAEVEAESVGTDHEQLCLSQFYSLLVKINSVNSSN